MYINKIPSGGICSKVKIAAWRLENDGNLYRIPGILHLWYTKSAPLVQRLCSLEVPFAPMVKHLRCTLACQVHLDCGTAPLPCMVQRAPSAVHLCCTCGTNRTIPIKLKYGTCARCGAPVVCSPLHFTPAAAEIHSLGRETFIFKCKEDWLVPNAI